MAAVTVGSLVIAGLAAAPARLGGGSALDVSLIRIVSALILCLILAGAAVFVLKRGGGRIDPALLSRWKRSAVDRRIEVIESRRISAHADVCLFRCDDRDYLVLASATELRVLRRGGAKVSQP